MISFYELYESEILSATNLEAGSFICCKDSTNIYMVPTVGGAPVKMADTVIFITDTKRQEILAPINGKFYFCIDTGKFWVYYNEWVCINEDPITAFDIEPVIVPSSGSVTVTDSRIKAANTGIFVPDLSVADLISDITVTCSDGSAVIEGTTNYDIPGVLKIS